MGQSPSRVPPPDAGMQTREADHGRIGYPDIHGEPPLRHARDSSYSQQQSAPLFGGGPSRSQYQEDTAPLV